MDQVKTYHQVNAKNHQQSFSISRMEDIYTKRKGASDDPHRHDFYTVVIVKKAKGQHVIDFKSYPLSEQQIFFVNPGTVHQVIEEAQSEGFAITFSNDFLATNNIHLDFIHNLDLFQDFGDTPPLQANNTTFERISAYCEQLIQLDKMEMAFKYEALGAFLKLILIQCNNICDHHQDPTSIDPKHNLLIQYKDLLNQHYKEWHGVNEYANALHVNADYLNRVVKQLTNKTAKDHIQQRILLAAKRLIFFSDLSAKELAFELGFKEPGNFSAFFKKHTGISPSEFKKTA